MQKLYHVQCQICGAEILANLEDILLHHENNHPDYQNPVEYYPSELRRRLFKKTDGHCYYCGVELSLIPGDVKPFMIAEHFIAKANGGSDRVANIVPACSKCNKLKGKYTIEQFRALLFHDLFTDGLFYFEKQGLKP